MGINFRIVTLVCQGNRVAWMVFISDWNVVWIEKISKINKEEVDYLFHLVSVLGSWKNWGLSVVRCNEPVEKRIFAQW